ncbi:hypothetical protein ACFFSY_02575 [Paenibacillus aurantiacus]|uniref:Lipoprotein n=1 Tax=Paenibacillus aurantiacus TaxID=1936118 RepID=A0ABV5KIV3_9BACL
MTMKRIRKPKTVRAGIFALLCLMLVATVGCGARLTSNEEGQSSTLAPVGTMASVLGSESGEAEIEEAPPASGLTASARYGDPADRAMLKPTLKPTPAGAKSETAAETPEQRATASADTNSADKPNPASGVAEEVQSFTAKTTKTAVSASASKQKPYADTTTRVAVKSTVALPAGQLKGNGLYMGQIDTHSVEININGVPTVFQIDETIEKKLNKISDHADGTPVRFTYTRKEIEAGGEKYVERWLTGIQER